MRTTRLALVVVALPVVAACSDPFEPSTGRVAPGEEPREIGIYVASGFPVVYSMAQPPASTLPDTVTARGGSGYIGSGH